MSDIPVTIRASRESMNMAESMESLINQTQTDLELFRHEQDNLRKQIQSMLEDNRILNKTLAGAKNTKNEVNEDESQDDATRDMLNKDALKNVQTQIKYLEAENHELRSLNQSSQKTIQNLEIEIQNYRNQIFQPNSLGEVKQKYAVTVRLMEKTIKNQNIEITEQAEIIENLEEEKNQLNGHIAKLELILQEKDRELSKYNSTKKCNQELQERLLEATRRIKDLEKHDKQSQRMLEEHMLNEKRALHKVQEALALAKDALKEKDEAEKERQITKEEYNSIAAIIGKVMDDAARKVDKDMLYMRKQHLNKEKDLLQKQEQLKLDLRKRSKLNEILEARCKNFEKKFTEIKADYSKLMREYEAVTTSLEDSKLQLAAKDKLLQEEAKAAQHAAECERQIQRYLETIKGLRERYRAAVEDTAKKCEEEIYSVQNENAKLKAEIQLLKLTKVDYFGALDATSTK